MQNARDDADTGGGYSAQLDALRSAAKWLLAASAAVGALLVAGLQLTGIRQLPADSWRLYVAIGAAGVTLLTIGYMIKIASTVLTQEWLTLADFTDEAAGLPPAWGRRRPASVSLKDVEDRLTNSRHELFGHAAPTLAELHRLLQVSHEATWREDLDAAHRREAEERSSHLRRTAREVVQAANYYYALRLFGSLRVRMAFAAIVGVVGIGVFAYVAGPTQSAPADSEIVSNCRTGP